MSLENKPKTIQFFMSDLGEVGEAPERNERGGFQDIKNIFFGKPVNLDFDKVQKQFNDRIFEVLSLLSESNPMLENFQIDSINFSVGVNTEGEVSILGIGGLSVGAEVGFQVNLVRK